MLLRIVRRACIGFRRGLGLITALTVLPVASVGYSAAMQGLQMQVDAPNDCAYQVITMASGQPGADPIAAHHCFAPTSFMGSKSDEEFQTAVRPLIPSQARQFEYVVHDPYPSSVYAFHMDQDGLIANVGAN
jgi:hypothetical protein